MSDNLKLLRLYWCHTKGLSGILVYQANGFLGIKKACLKQISYFKACILHFGIPCILFLPLLFAIDYVIILFFILFCSITFLSIGTTLTIEKETILAAIFTRISLL